MADRDAMANAAVDPGSSASLSGSGGGADEDCPPWAPDLPAEANPPPARGGSDLGQWQYVAQSCLRGNRQNLVAAVATVSVDECKALCLDTSGCQAFEYGVDYGGARARSLSLLSLTVLSFSRVFSSGLPR